MQRKNGVTVRQDDLSDGNVIALLQAHRLEMLKHSPPESVHALDTHQLHAPNVTFWSAWACADGDNNHSFAGCGALKDLGQEDLGREGLGREGLGQSHGELKSMKTHDRHLRKGVAESLLRHILDHARESGFQRLSLETGTQDVFAPARALYTKYGFEVCEPFADYRHDPLSVCMTLTL